MVEKGNKLVCSQGDMWICREAKDEERIIPDCNVINGTVAAVENEFH